MHCLDRKLMTVSINAIAGTQQRAGEKRPNENRDLCSPGPSETVTQTKQLSPTKFERVISIECSYKLVGMSYDRRVE